VKLAAKKNHRIKNIMKDQNTIIVRLNVNLTIGIISASYLYSLRIYGILRLPLSRECLLMKYLQEIKGRIHCSCDKCGNIMDVPSIDCKQDESGNYTVRYEVKCMKCRKESWIITHDPSSSNEEIKCPKCASTQLSANTKGFGLGKAAVGGVLLGPVGLLGGFVGSKKVKITCLRCGHDWEAGSI
jgi:tellurium resistance protein TerD